MDAGGLNNFRTAVLNEPNLIPPMGSNGMIYGNSGSGDSFLRTPYAGNVRTLPPPIPQPPTQYGGYGSSSYGSGYGSYGSFNGGFGGGYGGGFGGFGGGYGGFGGYGYNRFGGMNPMDPEARFIQLAEASSRPAFASIESLVSAIGNIAAMLDSTFFALTSSFRAILGVAANFGRLRGVFAQFWQTMAIFRGLNWIYRKFLYWLRISKVDPSTDKFKKAFVEAANETAAQSGAPQIPQKGQSPWPVIAFLSFIFTVPYLVMKLLSTITNTAQEEARNPAKWVQPIETVALYDFQARNGGELTLRTNSKVIIAPKEIQNTLHLLNTGWALATIDGQNTGIIPINYVKSPQQIRQERLEYEQQQQQSQQVPNLPQKPLQQQEPDNIIPQEVEKVPKLYTTAAGNAASIETLNLSRSKFPPPPKPASTTIMAENDQNRFLESLSEDFDIAPQPIGPPSTLDVSLSNGLPS